MSLATARRALADHFQTYTDLGVHDHVPDKLDAAGGALIIEPADDYVTHEGTTFAYSEVKISVHLWLMVEYRGDNESADDDLDAALAQVVLAMPGNWRLESTGKPGPQTNGEWTHHGIQLTVTTVTTIT